MSRYIDADKLPRHGQRGGLVHWKDIAEAPSIDIVRCKECKWRIESGFTTTPYLCDLNCRVEDLDGTETDMWFYVKDDDYCSRGERKENEQ